MSNFVGGKGPKNCFICFVGEAPGAYEDRMLEPFVGPAGRLFTQALTGAGIIRTQCYITNAIKHRPPRNDEKEIIDISGRGQPKLSDKWHEYVDILREELRDVRANVFVATGNIALYALTGKVGITKWRGSVLESTLLPSKKVIPIIHPSTIFHDFIAKRIIDIDLVKIGEQAKFPDIRRPKREIHIEPTFEEAMTYLTQILDSGEPTAFDIETPRGNPKELLSIAFTKSPTDIMCIPFKKPGANYFTPEHELEMTKMIAKVLGEPGLKKIAQNAMFDCNFLYRRYGIITRNLEDTMVAHRVLYPDLPASLAFMTSVYTEEPYYKDEGELSERTIKDWQEFWVYNAKDSAVTKEIWPSLWDDLKTMGNISLYRTKMALMEPLLFMTTRGTRVNNELIKSKSEDSGDKLKELNDQFHELTAKNGKPDLNPASSQQMAEYFYEILHYKPYVNVKTKKVTTDEKALKRLSRKGCDEAKILLEIREHSKLKSTYYDIPLGDDGRMRSDYSPVGTKTSRLSSRRTLFGEGTNYQNQPAEMKEIFMADEGYLIYNVDLSQAENRVVAYIAPEPRLIAAFEDNIDVHSMTASLMFDIPYDEIVEMHEQDVPAPVGRGTYTHRYWGKKSNHSFDYGEGYKYFAHICEIPEKDAKFIHTRWHGIFPGVREYWRWVEEDLYKDRTLVNLYGHKRRFMGKWGHELFKDAYAHIPSSTVVDKINLDGLMILYEVPEVELLNQVHDSIVFQIPTKLRFEEHRRIVLGLVESLEKPLHWRDTTFSIPAEVEVGFDLKNTESVDPKDEQGFIETLEDLWLGN